MKFYLNRAMSLLIVFSLFSSGLLLAEEKDTVSTDRILPADTLFYMGVDDCALMKQYAESMPFTKILQEEEVVKFLEKPKAFVQKAIDDLMGQLEEQNEELAGELSGMCDISFSRFFVAFTHMGMPDMTLLEEGKEPIPDVGLAIGLGLKNGVCPEKLLKSLLNALAEEAEIELAYDAMDCNGIPYTRLSCPFAEELPLYYFHLKDLFILSLSENTVKAMIDCYQGKSDACLAKRDVYKSFINQCELPAAGSSQIFVDLQGMFKLCEELLVVAMRESGEEDEIPKVRLVFDKLGLDGVNALFARGLSKDGVARGVSLVSFSGEPKGLLKAFPADPIEKSELKMVPRGASQFNIFRFDLAALYDLIMEVIQSVDEGVYTQVQGGLAMVSAMISGQGEPIDLRRDVIGQFGTRCLMYSLGGSPAMGAMMPTFHVFLEINDFEKFINTLQRILDGVGNMNPEISSAVSMSTIDYMGQPIHYLQISELPMVTPCFTEIGDYLAFGIQTNDLKKLIKGQGEETESILDSDDFKKMMAQLPQDKPLHSISYSMTRENFAASYNQISMYLPLMTMALPPEIELPIDLELRPTADCIEKHLFSSISANVGVDDHTVKTLSYGPIGGEAMGYLLTAAVGGGVAAALLAKDMGEAPDAFEIAMDDEAALSDPALFEKTVRTDLAALSNGCFVYKIEYNKYPATLEDLLTPTDDWPNGFFSAEKLPVDPWGNGYLYKNLEGSDKNYMIWSLGPNGVDEGGKGDDIMKVK